MISLKGGSLVQWILRHKENILLSIIVLVTVPLFYQNCGNVSFEKIKRLGPDDPLGGGASGIRIEVRNGAGVLIPHGRSLCAGEPNRTESRTATISINTNLATNTYHCRRIRPSTDNSFWKCREARSLGGSSSGALTKISGSDGTRANLSYQNLDNGTYELELSAEGVVEGTAWTSPTVPVRFVVETCSGNSDDSDDSVRTCGDINVSKSGNQRFDCRGAVYNTYASNRESPSYEKCCLCRSDQIGRPPACKCPSGETDVNGQCVCQCDASEGQSYCRNENFVNKCGKTCRGTSQGTCDGSYVCVGQTAKGTCGQTCPGTKTDGQCQSPPSQIACSFNILGVATTASSSSLPWEDDVYDSVYWGPKGSQLHFKVSNTESSATGLTYSWQVSNCQGVTRGQAGRAATINTKCHLTRSSSEQLRVTLSGTGCRSHTQLFDFGVRIPKLISLRNTPIAPGSNAYNSGNRYHLMIERPSPYGKTPISITSGGYGFQWATFNNVIPQDPDIEGVSSYQLEYMFEWTRNSLPKIPCGPMGWMKARYFNIEKRGNFGLSPYDVSENSCSDVHSPVGTVHVSGTRVYGTVSDGDVLKTAPLYIGIYVVGEGGSTVWGGGHPLGGEEGYDNFWPASPDCTNCGSYSIDVSGLTYDNEKNICDGRDHKLAVWAINEPIPGRWFQGKYQYLSGSRHKNQHLGTVTINCGNQRSRTGPTTTSSTMRTTRRTTTTMRRVTTTTRQTTTSTTRKMNSPDPDKIGPLLY